MSSIEFWYTRSPDAQPIESCEERIKADIAKIIELLGKIEIRDIVEGPKKGEFSYTARIKERF